ncbi:TOMM system kinase/cyclase fusion protein [Thalassomonas actiniarum]|uniref:TOMM system kinase/cyclase fusion protein n=1 Tax=Thalassomonas actiniarum TaxID=485447 RepID=A0AAE9YUR0_9GAMM|nr:TOMM system kinase/cyclase fusion protein [Thalassomonas actiniarum]WDE01600.1 TOMM system kinase/cyclase fusion protein [Thalassomonas actiniarum]
MTITTINTLEADLGFVSDAYRLVRKIGQGGFGQVYLAKQLNTNQDVAIKFLSVSSDFDDAKKKRYIERFDRETLLCSRLQHPNIVRLLDKGCCHDNLLYAVFEYVDGKTLKETLSESGALLPVDAAAVMGQVLDALAHAHEQGVIHRDIKPANIMLTKVGAKIHAKVLDFGIGTLVNEVRQLDYKSITLTQETLGTPSYSAPEQLRGEPPTPKTDIYVWGLVFIECLTGKPAISGTSLASVFHKQLSQSNVPLPPSLAGHSVSALLRRVLNKKAGERASNAAELYHAFHQLNFSTLVGDLTQNTDHHFSTDNTLVVQPGDNETLINDTQINDSSVVQATYASLTERKQITALAVVLNVKAIGDSEPDGEVVDAIHRDQKAQCIDTAVRYGAFHVGSLGNTLLFYFGYPVVSDNDGRLCARTALEISSKLSQRSSLLRQNQGIEVRVHMGMHTGIVTTYADATPEGDTTNIVLDLARLAEKNQVLATQSSKTLLESYLTFQPQQAVCMGVKPEPVALYSLVGERQVEAFGFLRVNKNNHDFIGREQELFTLGQLLKAQANVDNRIDTEPALLNRSVHVYGEAGIGKSRLVFELRSLAASYRHFVAQCLPEHKNNALYPVLNLVKYKYSLDSLTAGAATAKLHRELKHSATQVGQEMAQVQDALVILCSWLALPLPEGVQGKPLSPDVQKDILFKALITLLLSRETIGNRDKMQPVLFLFEDLHWADPTTIAFIAELSSASLGENEVFISTSRQPLPQTLSHSGFASIALTKLSQEKTAEFVFNLFDKQQVSTKLLDVVVSRTDGIPLFIEELVNMLKQKGLVQHLNGITDFIKPDNINEVPGSLRDSLQQKLDTLIYAKETAQLAATIGREFDYALLAAASNHSAAQLQTDLNELIEADLIILQRKVAGNSYIFKHALVRDAAYESMLNDKRMAAHNNVAGAFVDSFPDFSKKNPFVIASHYAKAGNDETAVTFGIDAVVLQIEKSANDEAYSYANLILPWVKNISCEVKQIKIELNLLDIILPAVMSLSGYGGDEVSKISHRIEALIDQLERMPGAKLDEGYTELTNKVEWSLFLNSHYSSQRAQTIEVGNRIIARARKERNRQREMVVLTHLGQAHLVDGNLKASLDMHNASLQMYSEALDKGISAEYGTDPKAQNLSMLTLTYIHLGMPEKALESVNKALAYSEVIGHDVSITFAHLFKALYAYFMNDRESVITTVQRYELSHGDKKELVWINTFLYMLYDWALYKTDFAELSIKDQLESGQLFALAWYEPSLADTYLELKQYDKAINLMENSLQRTKANGEYAALPFVLSSLAKCYYVVDKTLSPRVEQMLNESLRYAREQKAIFFELHSLVYYYPLIQDKTKKMQVQSEINMIVNGSDEMKDTAPYRKAMEYQAESLCT